MYLAHAVLGERLRACTEAVCQHEDKSAHAIFGSPDDLKFRSSMTLFAQVSPEFERPLALFFENHPDPRTLELLAK